MSAKSQHNNILLAIIGFTMVVATVAVIGYFTLGRTPEVFQGEMEVSEYRVTCKLPGRIAKLYVKEGDYVHAGDTLVKIEIPGPLMRDNGGYITLFPNIDNTDGFFISKIKRYV